MKFKFRQKRKHTNGEWIYQECKADSLKECIEKNDLRGFECFEYEILSVDGQLTKEGEKAKQEEGAKF